MTRLYATIKICILQIKQHIYSNLEAWHTFSIAQKQIESYDKELHKSHHTKYGKE
jgi:hypothetical protein